MQSFLNRHRVLLIHLSFWGVYFSFSLYQINSFRHGTEYDWEKALSFAIVQMAFMVFISYLNYLFLLPGFLKEKKLFKYLVEFTVPFVILIYAKVHILRYLVDGNTHREWYFYTHLYIVHTAVITLFIVIFVGMLRFAEDWFELEARKKEVENERLNAELKFLRSQIQPHFLFNTLNNLYYLAYKKSPKTTEVIERLSNMMRYVIYETNQPEVELSKEILYIKNYISLEQMRLNDPLPVTFTINGNPEKINIVPLILITFLENAFKHGINKATGGWINLSLNIGEDHIVYSVENSKPGTTAGDSVPARKGIGLENVKRRLDLSYPGKHHLDIVEKPETYYIKLSISLS